MSKIERTGQFRRDYKREARGQHRASLDADLVPILVALADDQPLEVVAQWEHEAISERTAAALAAKRARGERISGQAPSATKAAAW